jgi:hypothetical protein
MAAALSFYGSCLQGTKTRIALIRLQLVVILAPELMFCNESADRSQVRQMNEIADGWEVISCRAKAPWHLFFMLLQILVGNPDIAPVYSMATWTVRHGATGVVRKVTARSEQQAKERIADGIFDAD